MKSLDVKHQFINLRAKDESYDKISNKLNVSKQTLITWNKEFYNELQNLKAIELDSIRQKYKLSKVERMKTLSELFQKLKNELYERNLKDITTDKLYMLLMKMDDKLQIELNNIKIIVENDEFLSEFKLYRNINI